MSAAIKHPAPSGLSRGWVKYRVGDFLLDADWEVGPGQVLTLFGPSGAGKTTLLRAIAGLVRPREGHIEINGRIVFDSYTGICVPPHHRRIGFLTQSYNLFPHLTLAGNIAYGLSRMDAPSRRARVDALVERFQLIGLENRLPAELSGGQQQRAALARALAPNPALMLLDEPFSSLDVELRRTLRRELRASITRDQVPAILVTHDIEEAISLGDQVKVISSGRVEASGSPLEILGQPGRGQVARLVGVENLLRLQVTARYPQDGTMVCAVGSGGQPVETPLSDAACGERVTVGIRASDIILADTALAGSSARNQLPGVVSDIQLRPPGYEVTLHCPDFELKCHITGASLHEMQIDLGHRLWAVFKASSCFLVQDED